MRTLIRKSFVVGLVALAQPAVAACPMGLGEYAQAESDYILMIRNPAPWESTGMTSSVIELRMPDGTELWGEISGNMGTSRDEGRLYHGCERPSMDGPGSTDEELEACRVWEGVVYALGDRSADYMPFSDEPTPDAVLLSDLGRQIRYGGPVSSPGDEPWDVFTLSGCLE